MRALCPQVLQHSKHCADRFLTSPAAQRWTCNVTSLALSMAEGDLPRKPGFQQFVHNLSRLRKLSVYCNESAPTLVTAMNAAFCDEAMQPSSTLQELVAAGYVPSLLPRSLQLLSVVLHEGSANVALLPLLLVRMQRTSVSWLYLDLQDLAVAQLNGEALSGLQLPTLKQVELRCEMYDDSNIDLSWLGLPRAFQLNLAVDNKTSSEEGILTILQWLQDILLPQDSLHLCTGPCNLSFSDKAVLSRLPVRRLSLRLPPQSIDFTLVAKQIEFGFAYFAGPAAVAELYHAAVAQYACRVSISMRDPADEVHVLGYLPVLERPWQLTVTGATCVGVPAPEQGSQLCFVRRVKSPAGSPDQYVLQNQLAADIPEWT